MISIHFLCAVDVRCCRNPTMDAQDEQKLPPAICNMEFFNICNAQVKRQTAFLL